MSAIHEFGNGNVTARAIRSESRTVSQTTGDTTVTYHQIRSVEVSTVVRIGVYTEAPASDTCVTDSTAIASPQSGATAYAEDDSTRLSSNVTWNPITGKAVKTNTFLSKAGAWTTESRDQN